jgi:hypothetical protein
MKCERIAAIADQVKEIVMDFEPGASATGEVPDSDLWQRVRDCGTRLVR